MQDRAGTALIIGASRGIGFELARQYRADNWEVVPLRRRLRDNASTSDGVGSRSGNTEQHARQDQTNYEHERETATANTHFVPPN